MKMFEHLSRYPIVTTYRNGYLLQTSDGERISFHRTISGALRRRRQIIEDEQTK